MSRIIDSRPAHPPVYVRTSVGVCLLVGGLALCGKCGNFLVIHTLDI